MPSGVRVAVDDVVGDRQQRLDEQLVVLVARGPQLVAVGGGLAQHEAALGAHRHDQHVLDHLRGHQPVDLGAEVVGAVAEAEPPRATLPPRRCTPSKSGW
jgi:hypothetical protein